MVESEIEIQGSGGVIASNISKISQLSNAMHATIDSTLELARMEEALCLTFDDNNIFGWNVFLI